VLTASKERMSLRSYHRRALAIRQRFAAARLPIVIGLVLFATSAFAQAPSAAAKPIRLGTVDVSGSLRTRTENWNWFKGNADNTYVFQGSLLRLSLGQAREKFDWQLEMALPVLLGLPDEAVAAGVQGQLGAGATYFVSNERSRNTAMLFPKQAFVRFKGLGGRPAHRLRVGRIEFIEGGEVAPTDATLATVKRDRIAHRLLGNFGFTHVMRSFDGLEYTVQTSRRNLTLFGGRPTRGVFQVNGWGELNAAVFYAALTGQLTPKRGAGEWRLFVMPSTDSRSVTKTDNRPAPVRSQDFESLRLVTIGGHYLHRFEYDGNQIDALFWGTVQTGKWGKLDQRSGSISLEAGWQPKTLARLRPWLRAGLHHSSGDREPNDDRHGTFYQLFPTARWYARFPFYALMNLQDRFGSLLLRPSPRVTIRTEIHSLRLAERNDLWYQGGGAFQPSTFGYAGRTSNGHRGLATVYDSSLDYLLRRNLTIGGYLAVARGNGVMKSIYPAGRNASLGFLEGTVRF
jgi:Alginate export